MLNLPFNTEDGINYTVNNNSVVIVGGNKDAKNLDIKVYS